LIVLVAFTNRLIVVRAVILVIGHLVESGQLTAKTVIPIDSYID